MNIRWLCAKLLKKLLNPPALNSCNISKESRVCSRSELTDVSMGRYSYIGNDCFMVNVEIGSFCSIADRVAIGGAAHPVDRVSSSPVFHQGRNIMRRNLAAFDAVSTPRTTIENDVWIGRNALIKAGVTIHNGAVIGMGSIVTHDVGPYEIWAGNPARMLRKRFPDDTANRLQRVKWWMWTDEKILQYADVMDDPVKFLDKCEVNGDIPE